MPFGNKNTILNFTEKGRGKTTLVFLHYFGGSSNSWEGVTEKLKRSFHCLAIDLAGFGNSAAPDKELSVHDSSIEVVYLLQSLQLKNYVLIGHSMGGKIALAVASKKPVGLISLILIAPSPPTPEPGTEKDRKKLAAAFGNRNAIEKLIEKITVKQLSKIIFEETVSDHLKVSPLAWAGWIHKGSREDISSLMPNINVPVAVISGSGDPNFSTKFLRKEFMKYFPAAGFFEIPQAGHLLPVEQPLAVSRLIQQFILK